MRHAHNPRAECPSGRGEVTQGTRSAPGRSVYDPARRVAMAIEVAEQVAMPGRSPPPGDRTKRCNVSRPLSARNGKRRGSPPRHGSLQGIAVGPYGAS